MKSGNCERCQFICGSGANGAKLQRLFFFFCIDGAMAMKMVWDGVLLLVLNASLHFVIRVYSRRMSSRKVYYSFLLGRPEHPLELIQRLNGVEKEFIRKKNQFIHSWLE